MYLSKNWMVVAFIISDVCYIILLPHYMGNYVNTPLKICTPLCIRHELVVILKLFVVELFITACYVILYITTAYRIVHHLIHISSRLTGVIVIKNNMNTLLFGYFMSFLLFQTVAF